MMASIRAASLSPPRAPSGPRMHSCLIPAWPPSRTGRSPKTTGPSTRLLGLISSYWLLNSAHSGLINQSVIAAGLCVICIASHEYMKRKRRGKYTEGELGSVESWQFG